MYCLKSATLLVALVCATALVVPTRDQDTKTPTPVTDNYCPDPATIAPCICREASPIPSDIGITCRDLNNTQLERVFKADFQNKHYPWLSIVSDTVTEIRKGFNGVTFDNIAITAPITKLDPQFFLTSNETVTKIIMSSFKLHHADPVWAAIKDLKVLQLLGGGRMELSTMPTLESDSLTILQWIMENNLSSIPSGSLTGLTNLTSLQLIHNPYMTGASTFGDKSVPLRSWTHFGFEFDLTDDTFLTGLNPEMFVYPEGPSAVKFRMAQTNVSVLSNETFKEIIDRTSCLTTFDFGELYTIKCDCSLAWIFDNCYGISHKKRTYRQSIHGFCQDSTAIKDLFPKDFANCTTTTL